MDVEPQSANLSSEQERHLWQRLRGERDTEARAQLVHHHMRIARIIAARLFADRPSDDVEFNDYLQFANIGLLESIDRYDPTQNASFATYASYRIRGAVLDGLQHLTERGEQNTFRRRVYDERLASVKDSAAAESSDVFHELVDVAIGLALGYMLDDSGMYRDEDSEAREDPYGCYELKDLQTRINKIVEALPTRERMVIHYHYFQNMPFVQIADVLDISKGRVSQLHARALELLKHAHRQLTKIDVSV